MELQKHKDSLTGEVTCYGKHESGLEVYIMPRKDYTSNYAIFTTRYGSIHSDFIIPGEDAVTHVPDGIAHYLEHKMFDQPDGSNVFDKFSKLGANANAFTSFNMTSYLFSSTDNFEENLLILMDYVQSPYFTEESVQKEQGIIGQEIRMYDDNGPWRVFFNLLCCLYHNHPVRKDIAGTIESISEITSEYLYKCYNTFYNLSNMILFVTGDFDEEKIASVIEKGIKKSEPFTKKIENIFPTEPSTVYKKRNVQKLDVSMPLFMIGFKDNDNGYDGDRLLKKYIEVLMLQKLIFGKSTKFYKKLYESGLINGNFSTDYTAEKSYGYSTIDGESPNPDKVYEAVAEEIKRIKEAGISEEDFNRVKKAFWGDYIRMFNDIEEYSHSFVSLKIMGVDIFNYTDVYNSITLEDVINRFNTHFDIENSSISIVLPTDNE